MINRILSSLQQHFSLRALVFIGLIIAVLVMIILLIMIVKSTRRAGKQRAQSKLNPQPGRISQLTTWWQNQRKKQTPSDLHDSFLVASDFLEKHLGGDFQYQLPWFLLLGNDQAGKTSFLKASHLSRPVGNPDLDYTGCGWWFFSRGIVLDFKGSLFTGQDYIKSWQTLINLFLKHRARRPLDGIILMIPATELYGKNQATEEQIADMARTMTQQMHKMQRDLGLRMPIYIVVSKCDTITGFNSFVSCIPESNKQNIFGWSNPYVLNMAYQNTWIDEAFFNIQQHLNRLRLEIFATQNPTSARDDIFIFGHEMMKLKRGIDIYLSNIFRENPYEPSLYFRGIYFCSQKDDIGTFIRDILDQKIFAETGLSEPLGKHLKSSNHKVRLMQASLAAFVGIGSLGAYHAYRDFSHYKNELVPVFNKINNTLNELNTPQNALLEQERLKKFDSYIRELFNLMHEIQQVDFFSVFVPASWFSPLGKHLYTSLRTSYQQIVLRSLYINLFFKAKELIELRPTFHDQSRSVGLLLRPLVCLEYNLFQSYVENITKLIFYIDKYNTLGRETNPESLNELLEFTFKTQLSPDFFANYQNFVNVLRNTPYEQINLHKYRDQIQNTLRIIYQHYLTNLFSTEFAESLYGRIKVFSSSLARPDRLMSVKDMVSFSNELTQGVEGIGPVGNNWIDSYYFNPKGNFDNLMNMVEFTQLLGGKPMVEELAHKTATTFNNFRKKLITITPELIDVSAAESALETNEVTVAEKFVFPSQGIIGLEKGLRALLSQPFMLPAKKELIIPQIPYGKLLKWDVREINLIRSLVDSYAKFEKEKLPFYAEYIRQGIRDVAQQRLQDNINSHLAAAQSFEDLPFGFSSSPEDTIKAQIQNLRTAVPPLLGLLRNLGQESFTKSYDILKNLLASVVAQILRQLDNTLVVNSIFEMRDPTFDWWNGDESPVFGAYGVQDMSELRAYLAQEREKLNSLALDYAEPLVKLLTAQDALQLSHDDRNTLNRWQRIILEMKAYQKRRDNNLNTLQSFLEKEATGLNLGNCLDELNLTDLAKSNSNDFFTAKTNIFKRKLAQRCEILKRDQSIDAYNEIAASFTKNLISRFPFTSDANSPDDVTVQELQDFFTIYNQMGGSAEKILDQVYQLGTPALELMAFLQSMGKLYGFFKNYIEIPGGQSLGFKVDFRVHRDLEKNAENVLEWGLNIGNQFDINQHSKTQSAKWNLNREFVVFFKWADGSPVAPQVDPKQPNLKVNGRVAMFSYGGRWALLRLIKRHAVPELSGRDSIILKFVVPHATSGSTVLYNRIRIVNKDGVNFSSTIFPITAPKIGPEILRAKNKPILVDKIIRGS